MYALYLLSLESIKKAQNLTLTDSITTNITSGFEHEITAEISRQGCQGIHSTYSAPTFLVCYVTVLGIDFFNSGLKLYYGSYGSSDGLDIASDLSMILGSKLAE